MNSTIEEQVKRIIGDQLGIPVEEISLEQDLVTSLAADSLDLVEIVMYVEEEWNMEISDSDAEKIKTVGDWVSYIKSRTESGG